MAALSSKKTATSNLKTLKELHLISLTINAFALVSILVLKRPSSKWKYAVLSAPALACQYVLEKSGRPVYSVDQVSGQRKLVRSGDDIKGPGLFEYMFDCIYVTWFCDLLMVILGSNKVWYLYLVIPGFIGFKLISIARSFMGGSSKAKQATEPQAAATEQGKSKRQAKLELRGQRGQRVVHR